MRTLPIPLLSIALSLAAGWGCTRAPAETTDGGSGGGTAGTDGTGGSPGGMGGGAAFGGRGDAGSVASGGSNSDAGIDGAAGEYGLSAWTDCYPFDQPAPARLRASKKNAYAWYFPPYPISIHNEEPDSDYYARWLDPAGGNGEYVDTGGHLRDRPLSRPARAESHWRQLDFEVEVRQAIAAGLDGFVLEMTYRETHVDQRWNQTQAMLDAAQAVDPEFRILLAPGFPTADEANHEELRDTILRFAHHPSVLRLPDGRLPLSTFYPERPSSQGGESVAWWRSLFEDLESRGVDIEWVPYFLSRTSRNALDLEQWYATIAGYSIWDGKFASQASFNVTEAADARDRGLLWFAHGLFQDARLRKADLVEMRHWEPSGSATFRAFFEAAIEGDADWFSIVTWNDYGETQIAPSRARGHAVVDLLAYYTTWFKMGARPTIVRDALYYFHRTQPVDAPFDASQQTAGQYVIPAGPSGEDQVELVAFLTRPGRLTITQGEDTRHLDAQTSGLVSFVVPMVAEVTPRFVLSRDGNDVITLDSHARIHAEVVYQDMTLQGGGSLVCERPDRL